mgnify:CR=1 FL=1
MLKEKQEDLIIQKEEHTKADENFYLTASHVFNLAKQAKNLFISSEIEEKRELLSFLLQKCQLDGKKLIFQLKTPFDRVLEANNCSTMLRLLDSNQGPTPYTLSLYYYWGWTISLP